MVRETRHLWVGNLPDNIREDRIREHFKRYGRVQSVKLLPRSTKEETGEGTMACTVAFMDIKSASKAHNTEHKVDDRTLTTEYYEPAAIPSSASPQTTTSPYSTSPGSTRFPNGHSSSDEHGPFAERFYERANSRVAADGEFIRRGGYHDANRSRNRDRGFRNGPYNVIMDRGSHRTLNNSWSYDSGGGAGTGGRYNSQNETGYTTTTAATATTATVVDGGGSSERRGTSDQSTKKKNKSRSGSRSPSPSGSTSSRSPSRSRSRSSSSSSSSSTSRTSSTSTPKSRRTAANSHLAHSDDRRPLAICVRNLPLRSSDTSLKDGLYHEYKKHGKVTSVKVVGQNSERHAIVCFKKPEDVEKALEVSYDKLFFGCKIDVAAYQGFDVDDNDLRPYEAEIDEFHPKATRTLFIGNLEKDTTASDLRKHFDQFGEIIEIDIKNQGNVSLYAFCQYSDIVSVVKAIRKMDGEHLGNNRIKLGFGKSMPTNVVWVDGIAEIVTEKYLRMQFDPFGPISKASIDRDRGQALIFYEQMVGAQSAVSKMRGYSLKGNKIQVDFASRECQQSFYEHLEKQAPAVVDRTEERRDSTSRSFDSSRFARYDTPTRPRASSYSSRSSIAASQVASAIPSPGTPGSVTPRGTSTKTRIGRFNDYYEGGEVNDRHFRSYDEYSQGSAASQDDPYDPDYSYNNHESPMLLDVISTPAVAVVDHPAVPYAPPDIRNLQKERVHLLEQLEDCPSSGDEHIVSKKRLKLDLLDGAIGTDVIIEANRDHRKVMEVRRLSDVGLKHHSRRPSTDNKHSRDLLHDRSAYVPHGICKRRKTGGSDSGSRSHHYDHSGSESVGGSRPGTPLCDERPENFQPSEPRRVPRERNGPLTLPLPRFASQIPGRGSVSVAGIKGQKDVVLSSPPPAVTSPRISNPKPSSPVHVVPPPASPPPRPPSLSSNSSDSENPPSPSLDERIKSLDEKYEKWSGSRALSAAGGDALAKLDATREKFRLRHKLLDFDLKEVQPSEIVKSVMAKRSVFDEDLKRLENVGEKYEPKDFTLFPRAASIIQSSTAAVPPTTASTIKITSPGLPISSMLSPRSSGNSMIPAKGLQYPFPSHPPIQPTTPTLLQQTPPATPSSVASPTPQIQTASTTTRSTNHGENRLKSCASASSDNRLSSKVNVNRSVVLNSTAPIKSSEKNSGNISSDPSVSTSVANINVETKVSRTIKQSDKLTSRRDSNNGSPRGDVKARRNSDVGSRRTEDIDKFSDNSAETDRKGERGKSEERRKEQQQKEKQRLENEMLERERLEKEQQEKERLEKERLEREKQEREKELEKERLEKERKEKERAERERLEKEHLEHEKREQERLKREREEHERQERLRREREEAEREKAMLEERQRKEKEEAEKKERELKEKMAEEERQARKERQAKKERHEAEKLEKERRREEEKKNKEDNHEKRKDDNKHRENHGDIHHKDNNVNTDKSISNNEHKYMKQRSKDEKDKSMHEIFRKNDSHDRNNSEKYNKHDKDSEKYNKHDKDSDYRRKESIKENRDNNTHEKLKDSVEVRHMSMDLDKSKSDSNKTKDNSIISNVGIKRRMSSQDNFEHMNEAKKPKLNSDHKKISERRDSKDSNRSDEKFKPKLKNSRSLEEKPYHSEKTNFIRESEEKRKEKDKDRDEKHRNKQKFDKQKSKSKSREKDLRESPTAPSSKELTDKDFLARLELRSTDDLEMQKEKRSETKEKRRYDLTDTDTEKREKDDKRPEGKRKDKPTEKNRSRDDQSNRSFEDKNKSQKKERIRKPTMNSSDNTDSDEPRKHSIFDIVDDEPAYISMYDKVKARSCKNMQKQEEEKRQEKIKAKFSQLKQSRAKREEKKRSNSWDEDSDSDRERNDKNDSKNRRNKMLIISSDEDFSDFGKSHKKRGVFTDSDSDRHRRHKNELTEASDDDVMEHKSSKSSRCVNETSDDDYKNSIKSEIYSMSKMEISSYLDLDLFKVKDEFRRSVEKERNSKQDNSFDKSDPELTESKAPLSEIKSEKMNNRHSYPENSSADESTEFKKEKLKKHKKKQKRPKHSLSSEDSNKFDPTESSQNDSSEKTKQHEKKKQHSKKEKKRDKSKDRDKSKKSKRSKSASKSDFKHDGKMENIFGSLSDSSENGIRDNETSENKMNNSFISGFNDENIPSRYSDSDAEKEKITKVDENDSKDDQKGKKRKERRRKEKERLLQEAAAAAALAEAADHFNENSMDFADMGKQLEANIKDEPVNQNDTIIERNDMNNQKEDIFKYYDNTIYQDFKKEDRKEGREKKKKRKKSKEERQKHHHHHHHHHHHEKTKVKSEVKKENLPLPREESCIQPVHETKTQSQSLPNLLDIPSPPQEKTSPRVELPCIVKTEPIDVEPETPTIPQQLSPVSSKDKKREKFIPGFGSEIDETIHENAVKSISDFDAIKPDSPKLVEVKLEKPEETPEEKPRAVISQEETEDAVAALLGESFSTEFGKHYAEEDLGSANDDPSVALVEEPTVQDDEEMRQAVQSLGADDIEIKPETPQSEHELQIDTDTEEQDEITLRFDQQPKTPDMSELLQPPKTPDIPTYYRSEESKLAPSPLVIKTTPTNIGSPPSLAPITQQSSVIGNAKRNLDKIEIPSKVPPLALPPLIEPTRTVISHPWTTKGDEVGPKVESKITVVTKVTSPQTSSVATPTSIITTSPLRTTVVKISESSYPPLTAISKQETTTTKADVPLATIPILQVTSPALHNLPARSPLQQVSQSNASQDSSSGPAKPAASISKIRLPITSVMVSKPLQAATINLPQPKVAFTSEPPKLIPTQEARPRMIFQNAGVPTSFPFNSTQKMLVQTNIPVAGGLLVPARPGHFNYIPSQVAFNKNITEKTNDAPKPTTVPVSIALGQSSPTKVIQMKPQSIIISPTSHISPVLNSQKIIKTLIPDNPPSLVAISSSESSSAVLHSAGNQTNVITSNSIVDNRLEIKKEIDSVVPDVTTPVKESTTVTTEKEPVDDKISPQKSDVESDNLQSSNEISQVKDEKPEVKIEVEEPKQKLAIETVTDELNQTLKEAMDSENQKQIKEEEVEASEPEKKEINPDVKIEDHEELKTKVENDPVTVKEPEKIEEEKTDSESIVSDISKDCSSADMPIKDLLLDGREDKEDSDYWSPKDVNIDSVIKTLCSADELSNHSNDNMSTKEEDHPNEDQIIESQKEQTEAETNTKETTDNKESDNNKSDTETMEDSVEDDDKEVLSRIATRRGGRGRGRKARGGIERGGIQTRRTKVLSKEPATPTKRISNVRGARAKVERKVPKAESEAPTDIYEFREDEENRPRLILTIKQSNTNSAAVQSAVVKEIPKEISPVQPPQKTIEPKEKTEDFTQPSGSTNTRKSKRLQEKDIFRTTVDDTIEDVVKNVVTRSSTLVTRRSTRLPAPTVKTVPETPRKSTRSRRIGRRASEATEDAPEDKEKPKIPEEGGANTTPETSKIEVEKPKEATIQANTAVTEKDENKQVPQVTVKETIPEKPPIGLKAAVLRRIKGEMGQQPMTLIDPVTGLLTPMRECEENKYIPVPGENKPGFIATSSQQSSVVTSTVVKPMQQTVITSSQQSTPVPTVKQQSKPQSLKAHVLSSQAAQAVVTQQIQPSQKQNAVIVSSAPSPLSVETKMNLQQSLSVSVSLPNFVPAHVSPRTSLTVASHSPKPVTVKQPVSSPSQMYNLMSQQMMQLNKTSLATVASKGIVSNPSLMTQQSIIKQVPLPKVPMLPKTSHPMHIPAGVPSSVLGKIPSQTIVTNASRLMQGKNIMEPPKVDVSLSNLMSVRGLSSLSPQGQARHHAQPGITGYEASLAETIPHFPPGSVTLRPHDLPPPHYMHPSHVMYQQYLRQSYHFPRSSVVSGGIEKTGDGQEIEEAPVTSPPLELRISNSVGLSLSSRGAAVPHSLHSPHDRATDSPQIGQVYNMPTARMQHYNMNRYYEPAAEPPPAHRPVTSHSSLAALGSDRPPLSHMAALGAHDRPLVPHLPPDRPLGSHLAPDRPLGSHLPPDRPLSGHSALTGHLPLGNPERPSSSHLPPDRPMSSHLTPDRLSGISTPDRPVSAHTMTLGAGLGAAGNLMGAVARHIGVDAPTSQRGLQAATPPHASQVPPQAESLNIQLKQFPQMWQGLLALKNDQAAVQMYFVSGNDYVAKCTLPKNTDGSTPPLRIFQRMRLEPLQVEGVARKVQMEKEHCMLLALPCGKDHMDVLKQSNNLTNGFIHYLQQKQAAGIVNVAAPGTTQPPAYVVHIFPDCSFVRENLGRIAPSLLEAVSDIAHLLIVITTV